MFRPNNVIDVSMLFQGLDQQQAEAAWRPFFDWLVASPGDFSLAAGPTVLAVPARRFWDPAVLKQVPGVVLTDNRPSAPESNIFWSGNLGEAGQVLHGYQSAWFPAALLQGAGQESLTEALFAATRHWTVSLHFNKGLAGAPPAAIEAAGNTATNPAVLDAFALLICAAGGPPAYSGIAGREPDLAAARSHSGAIRRAMAEVRKLLTDPACYLAESNFFEEKWQQAFWGGNYAALFAVKERYDPGGLFFVHHGVGSERWSADGFTRLSGR